MGMTPEVYSADGVSAQFPCIFPGGAGAVYVNGVSVAFTQGAGTLILGAVPPAGAQVQVSPKAVDQGQPATSGFKSGAAAPAPIVLKTAPGIITRVNGYNAAAYAVSIKLYDTSAAVVVGTTPPLMTITVPPASRIDISSVTDPIRFNSGIAFAITKNPANADATAVAADDLNGFFNWQ